ncbi:MAG: hypothetical protein MJK04_16730, partial [Psychrosphaera sp.]|nr:hypothetical protein [Psychrosphaera sp.]
MVNFYKQNDEWTLSFHAQQADGLFSDGIVIDQRTQESNGVQMSIVDHNDDGLLDIRLYVDRTDSDGYRYGDVATFYNQGNGGGFDVPDSIGVGGGNSYWGAVFAIDVNNDGVKDT